MVQAFRWVVFRDVVGACRPPAECRGGGRTAQSPERARYERLRLRLANGRRTTLEDSALRARRTGGLGGLAFANSNGLCCGLCRFCWLDASLDLDRWRPTRCRPHVRAGISCKHLRRRLIAVDRMGLVTVYAGMCSDAATGPRSRQTLKRSSARKIYGPLCRAVAWLRRGFDLRCHAGGKPPARTRASPRLSTPRIEAR